MQTIKFWKHLAFSVISLLPLGYLAYAWNDLPSRVATHFDINGESNGFTAKEDLWMVVGLMCGITLCSYYLMQYINRVDPKRVGKPVPSVIRKIAVVIVIFMTSLNLLMLVASMHPEQKLATKVMFPLLGMLFVFLGNYMYTVKPNYFVGIRLPWTLASDYNWRKTHQLGGIVWFACGILMTVTALLVPSHTEEYVFQALVAILIIIPLAYSFILFKKEHTRPDYFDKEGLGR